MHVPINVKSSNNISKWQMVFNSAFKGLIRGNEKVVLDLTFLKMVTNPQQIGQVENNPTFA
jgi:hypothetical protein